MNQHRSSAFPPHSSSFPTPVSDTSTARISSEQVDRSHRHSFIEQRNNHHVDVMQDEQLDEIPSRKRRKEYSQRSNRTLPVYINNALIILIRLMILFIAVVTISWMFYYAILQIYPQPKRTRWEQLVHWIYQE